MLGWDLNAILVLIQTTVVNAINPIRIRRNKLTSPFNTNEEIVQAARRNLAQGPWDYLSGGTESETTMRRNRLAFDRIAFRPRVLVDVSTIDRSSTLLGHNLRIPVLLAPIGGLQNFDSRAGVAVSQAADEFGTLHVVSSATLPTLEETAASTDRSKIYQLYIRGDWDWVKAMIDRVKQSGYEGLCITVDSAVYSRRERPLISRWNVDATREPQDRKWSANVTWETIDRIKEYFGGPFMLKGITTAEDAAIAVEHDVDVIWVSNHGGRQLDHGLGTMDILPEVMAAVGDKAEVVIDGGVLRGTDVIKAIALGAKAVAIGKLQGWGLAAGGKDGVVRVLEILEEEIRVSMGLLGVSSLDQLNKALICPGELTTMPHEMSAWVNMPGERLL
ncbi:MAG: alpha-hydroxy-acid oxidizing protein [SAR202 cluster bacterium]|nr:MAG: alpha-hydroxy-acid oxidizing protein [SAR202 cluster bacterium]